MNFMIKFSKIVQKIKHSIITITILNAKSLLEINNFTNLIWIGTV